MILLRSSSSEGSVASALIPAGSSVSPDSPPPIIVSLVLRLAYSTAAFAAATGSREKAIAVGPANSGASAANGVPSRARRTRRFLVTRYCAPALRIWRRSWVTSATDSPVWWVTTTHTVSERS